MSTRWLCLLALALGIAGAPLIPQATDAAGMIAEVVRTGSVIVSGVVFEPGRPEPAAGAERALGELRVMLNEHAEWTFEIQVHSDEMGDPEKDRALTAARADAVAGWLTAHGIAKARLVPRGYGSSKPLPTAPSSDPVLQHRRVELRKLNEE